MPKVKKLPKWAIKQAGGINKKAWALARRGKGRKMSRAKPSKRATRRTPRAVGGASHSNNSKPGWGRAFKVGRTVDVFSGPGQGALHNHGLTMEAGQEAIRRYSGNLSEGDFDSETAKATAGGIGTGMVRNWIRSKMGVYRGVGQKKYLSIVMAANPEILATSESLPQDNLPLWNRNRIIYDRAYDPLEHRWEPNPQVAAGIGGRFWQSIGLDAGLTVFQKAAERWINPLLPKGHNL